MKILVVDDNESNRYQMQALLSGNGYQVETAVQGAEALEISQRDPPDLIISDILMPVMDGYTLCRLWMQDERLRDIPFVFYTATYTDEREFALSLGARRFFVKPEEPDLFVRHIREVIRQTEEGALEPTDPTIAIPDPFSAEAPEEEASFLRQYNDVLIRKLEDKLEQLEQIRHELERDIAERKRAERMARDRECELQLIMDAAPALIAYVDRDLRFRRVNKSFERWFGLAPEQARGRFARDIMEESDWLSVRPYIDRALAGETVSFELEIAFGRCGKRWAQHVFVPDRDEAGHARGYVAHIVDISKRKKAEEDLNESNLLLEESNRQLVEALDDLKRTQKRMILQERLRALGEMASGIAHDFNNALMPILGFTEILLQHAEYLKDTEKATRYLNLILTAGQGAAKTVERLREFYRDRGGEETFAPVDLNRLIVQAIDLTEPKWKNEARMKGGEIEIKTFTSPAPTLMGDEADLREALVNLIFNAVDSMPEGGTLSLSASEEGEEILLAVSDTGIGMSEETKEKCLEPFYTTKERKGTGLGLAMVHGIVTRHRGRIEIESQEGCGATIRLRFPISAAA